MSDLQQRKMPKAYAVMWLIITAGYGLWMTFYMKDIILFHYEKEAARQISGYYPYYGLYHYLDSYYLGEKGFRYISDGSRTITNHSEIHDYLIHFFKYRKAYCKLRIKYKWWFGAIVRLLFPFRNIIWNRNVKAVLSMHEMQDCL